MAIKIEKSDKSTHNICIASIKRSTIKPYEFKWTKLYETNADFYLLYPYILLPLSDNELIICSMVIDKDNFSILTTRKLLTKEKGKLKYGNIKEATDKMYGDFKGYKTDSFTFGQIQLKDGVDLKYFIEVGKASMIMIHGVRTLIKTQQMTNNQVENTTKIWNKQNEK